METENIICENDNPEATAGETEKSDISIKKGLFLLIPVILAATVFLVCSLLTEVATDSIHYYLSPQLSVQMINGIIILLNIIPYIVTPLIYIVWLLISSRFISFSGGKKIYILSGLGGYVLGSVTIGLITELLCFFLSASLADVLGTYIRYMNIALIFVRSSIVPLSIFAFSIIIYAIVCKRKQKNLSGNKT